MKGEAILPVCAVLTLLIFAAGVLLAIMNRKELGRMVRILGVCVFLMLLSGIYPYYADEPYAVGLTLFESMCAMLLNSAPGEILAGFDAFDTGYIDVYKSVLLVLLIVAPLFTVGITLSFFSEKFTRIIYRVRSESRNSYLFSAVNERTLCIAEDVAGSDGKGIIVFAGRFSEDDIDAQAYARIRDINAYVINEDIVQIKHSLHRTRNYYLLDTDDSGNLEAALRIYKKYNTEHTDRVNMWLYSKNEISEIIFDHLYETFNVRLINEERLIARSLVTDHPLYEAVTDGRLSVLIVGGGHIGLEILRTVTMCSCLGEDVRVGIDVIDQNGDYSRELFEKTSPGLAEKWNIKFHTADVRSAGFVGVLDSIDPTYIVICLGNETLDMETAVYIRRKYGITQGLPRIHALVDYNRIEEQITPNLCVSDWKYNTEHRRYESTPICSFEIRIFGSYEETYKGLRIGASYRDCLAVAVNAANRGITAMDSEYNAERLTDLYNQVAFYKDYSDSFAVSVPYKLWLLGLELADDGAGDVSVLEELLEANIDRLHKHENRRYEAFMRGKGWTQLMPQEVRNGRMGNKLQKKHARIDPRYTEELERMTGRDFTQEDLRSIRNLPVAIRLANALYGKNYSVRRKGIPDT